MKNKGVNKKEMKKKVIEFVKTLKREEGKIDLAKLGKYLGIRMFNADKMDSPAIIVFVNGFFEIYINIREKRLRQRFSFAHEIAHFVLHKDKIKELGSVGREACNSLSPKEEREADELASQILMPDDCVWDFLNSKNINKNSKINTKEVEMLAKEFDVSFYAAILKYRDLNFYVRYM